MVILSHHAPDQRNTVDISPQNSIMLYQDIFLIHLLFKVC